MEEIRIIWSKTEKEELKQIYEYYKTERSVQAAKKVNRDILEAPKKIVFTDQYQIDEYNTDYRRIIVRDFKLLYKSEDNVVLIIAIISTRKNP